MFIPRQTRAERAAGISTVWFPGDKLGRLRIADMDGSSRGPYQPGPIVWIAVCAIGFFAGWAVAAFGPAI